MPRYFLIPYTRQSGSSVVGFAICPVRTEQVLQPAPRDHRPEIANWAPPIASTVAATGHTENRNKLQPYKQSQLKRGSVTVKPTVATTKSAISARPRRSSQHTNKSVWRHANRKTQRSTLTGDPVTFAEPLALTVRDDAQFTISNFAITGSTERIESGWWDHLRIARDYFVAQDQQAVRYWIYRERDTEQGTLVFTWFVCLMITSLSTALPGYAELHCLSNFTFLRGACHPKVWSHKRFTSAITPAITDECSLAGIVRAHLEAKKSDLKLFFTGTELRIDPSLSTRVQENCFTAQHREGAMATCEVITRGRMQAVKG